MGGSMSSSATAVPIVVILRVQIASARVARLRPSLLDLLEYLLEDDRVDWAHNTLQERMTARGRWRAILWHVGTHHLEKEEEQLGHEAQVADLAPDEQEEDD
eukprot:561489-Prymnesium_polylepis.1